MSTLARAPRNLLPAVLALAALLATGAGAAAQSADSAYDAPPRPESIADPGNPAGMEGSYGYFRIVEGGATVIPAGADRRDAGNPAAVNQPVSPGDRVRVAAGGRVEIVLADHNLLRLDGGSDVVLEQLAGTPDTPDRTTRLRLVEGNFQLLVVQDSLGDQLPRIDTPNSTLYIQYPGSYRVTADRGDLSSVVVRRGSAEVVTDRGSLRVRAGEEAHVLGERNARTDIAQAGGFDTLERWGRDLDAHLIESPYLDQQLAYQGQALGRYGSWLSIGGQPYWRPTVDGGWRPFTEGYWMPTASGLTWVATEPWGWVPYHYGSWDYVDGYGWVWEPGTVYSPAWVYWYWGPSQIGWCPVGYYTRWYGHRFHDPAFRFGVYGWAGGDWGAFANWNFVGWNHFGYLGHRGQRDLGRFVRRGTQVAGDLRGDMRARELPRGIITTDTRGITPGRWGHPDQVMNVLRQRGGERNGLKGGGNLPDVTSFVARKPNLPPQVLRAVTADTPDRGRFTGTPLRPGTLGTPPAAPATPAGIRSRWTARTPTVEGRSAPGVATPTVPPARPAAPATPGTPGHTWDRRADLPRAVPRPDAGNRAEQPAAHAWREHQAAKPVTPVPGNPVERAQPAPRYTPPATPVPRYTPPAPRYTPPPTVQVPRYTPATPQYTPPPAPRPTPPPAPAPHPNPPPPQRPAQAQKPPEHHGR